MSSEFEEIRAHLAKVHLFRELDDEDLDYIAEYFESVEFEADEVLYKEGDQPEWFGIILSGEVEVAARLDPEDSVRTVLAHLRTDDYFGEQAILEGARRSTTVTATRQTAAYIVGVDDFGAMLGEYPDVLTALKLSNRTRQLVRERRFHKWLQPDEVVFLIALTHWGWLARRLLAPVLLAIPLLGGLYLLFWLQLFWLPASIAVGLIYLAWIAVLLIDWRDDSYIVTNKRVISDERLALLYTARAEAPLYTVRSVQIKQDAIEQALGYGDVVVQTFTGSVTFADVPDPSAVANLITEHLERAQRSELRDEEAALERDIRVSIGWEQLPQKPAGSEQGAKRAERSAFAQLLDHFRPHFWEQEGNIITLRKHPIILIKRTGLGLLGLVILCLLTVLRLLPAFPLQQLVADIPLLWWLAGTFVLGLAVLSWTLYKFEDWRNDVYTITPNQVIDSEKKPLLGRVEQRTASIDSVLNVSYDRPGIFANAFNFGTVTIQTGGETGELTFDWVVNPLTVQQEIFRRMQSRRKAREAAAAARRRNEIVDWLRAYAAVTQPQNPADS